MSFQCKEKNALLGANCGSNLGRVHSFEISAHNLEEKLTTALSNKYIFCLLRRIS